MYTGIVQGTVVVRGIEDAPGLRTLSVELPDESLRDDLVVGASVGLDGVCLTVTGIDGLRVSFDVIRETLSRTTLGGVAVGDRLNVERSARAGVEIGGHELSGHVDGTATVVAVVDSENNRELVFETPPPFIRYVFPKGFIALNGCSLTVVDVDRARRRFSVHLIPETLRVTTFAEKTRGSAVNFEIERRTQIIVDTVRSYLEEQGATALAEAAESAAS